MVFLWRYVTIVCDKQVKKNKKIRFRNQTQTWCPRWPHYRRLFRLSLQITHCVHQDPTNSTQPQCLVSHLSSVAAELRARAPDPWPRWKSFWFQSPSTRSLKEAQRWPTGWPHLIGLSSRCSRIVCVAFRQFLPDQKPFKASAVKSIDVTCATCTDCNQMITQSEGSSSEFILSEKSSS